MQSQTPALKFEQLNAVDGLSHNKVQCILQDKQGYIWFGTVYGLNRYDGYSFKVFENIPGDSSSIGNNNIIGLFQDNAGIIWIGTSTILSSYDPRNETITNYNLPALKGWIHDFEEDENGLLWLATGEGLFSFNSKNKQVAYHKTDDSARENIEGILKDKHDNNTFWLSAETGIRKFNKKTDAIKNYALPFPAFEDISREITHNIIEDANGNIWMSTSGRGVCRLNPQTEKLSLFPVNISNTASNESRVTTQLMEDADGKIWIGTEGLCIYDPATNFFTYDKMDMQDNQDFQVKIRAILKDRSGIYWVGTERGIARYDPRLYSFITVKPNYPYTLQSANTIIEDNEHTFWVGNYIGLGTVNPNTGIYESRSHLLGSNNAAIFSSVTGRDGSLWFGSLSCLLHVFKTANGNTGSEKIILPVDAQIQVKALAFDATGTLWIGTRGAGLLRYDPLQKKIKIYKGDAADASMLSANAISSLCALASDSLLIGTRGKSLVAMNTKTEKFTTIQFEKKAGKTIIDYSIVNAIHKDNKGNIWIGTESGGLWQTDEGLSNFKNYSVKNGLQSMNVTQIVEDDKGQIWLNTSLGLEIIDPVHNRFVHYSEKDGLSINQPDYLIKKSSGDLLRVDFNGLHIFHSSSINLNKEVPPVYINHMQVLDREIPVYKDTTIHLQYDENYISFGYVALNYTQSFKNRYAYRLEGLDKKWIEAGDRRFATYANIGPGTYTFQVKASNNNGVWNETGASVTLIIDPPWWSTWWFYTLAILFVAAVIYILFQVRLQQELKAVEVRNTISQDLHDEVGSTLSSIGFLSSMALNDVDSNNTKVHSTLSSINESSSRMLDAMNDIIWNIQPKNDTMQNIIARMISFASEILEAKKIDMHINIADNINHVHLGLTARHDFYMIYKEAINNLAKYSCATEAWINLEFKQTMLILTIKDNGKGFDPEKIRDGNGLRNMQSRAKKIGGIYQLETVLNKGTTIMLQVKPA